MQSECALDKVIGLGTQYAGQQAAYTQTLRTENDQMQATHDAALGSSRRRFDALATVPEAAVAISRTESQTDEAQAAAYHIGQMSTQRSANSEARSAESSLRHEAQRAIMLQHLDNAEREDKRLEGIIAFTQQQWTEQSKDVTTAAANKQPIVQQVAADQVQAANAMMEEQRMCFEATVIRMKEDREVMLNTIAISHAQLQSTK